MDKSFGHAIFTRCKFPYSSFSRNANSIAYTSGIGIFSMTTNFLSEEKDELFQDRVFRIPNCSDPSHNLIVQSFQYLTPDVGTPMIGCIRLRSKEETDEAKATSAQSKSFELNDRSSYIGEWYTGNFSVYACDLMNALIWNAQSKPISHFYLGDNPEPLENPIDPQTIECKARCADFANFIDDGRKEALAHIIAWLMTQFDLQVEERKTLILRDTEENMRLWVSAIMHCLPMNAANQISFNTSMDCSEGENGIRYPVSASTHLFTENSVDTNTIPRPYYMVAGATVGTPAGDSSGSIPIYPVSPMVIKDAKKNTGDQQVSIDLPMDNKILNRRYFVDLIFNPQLIMAFLDVANNLSGITMGTSICTLYDHYTALASDSDPSYGALIRGLAYFKNDFAKNPEWLYNVLKRLCQGEKYNAYAEQDEDNNRELLSLLRLYADTIKDNESVRAIEEFSVRRAISLLSSATEAHKCIDYILELKTKEFQTYDRFLLRYIGDEHMASANLNAIQTSKAGLVDLYISMMNDYSILGNTSWAQIFNDTNNDRTLIPLLERSVDTSLDSNNISASCAVKWMKLLEKDSNALQQYVQFGTARVHANSEKRPIWWNILLAGGIPFTTVAQIVKDTTEGPAELNTLLCNRIATKGPNEETANVYRTFLQEFDVYAYPYYAAQLDYAYEKTTYASMIADVLKQAAHLSCFFQLIKLIDDKIRLTADTVNFEAAQALYQAGVAFSYAPHAAVLLYMNSLTHLRSGFIEKPKEGRRNGILDAVGRKLFGEPQKDEEQVMNSQIAASYLHANPTSVILLLPEDTVLTATRGGDYFVQYLAQASCADPFAHLAVVISFNFSTEARLTSYLNTYASYVSKQTAKGRPAFTTALYIRESLRQGMRFQGAEAEMVRRTCAAGEAYKEVLRRFDILITAVKKELADFKLDAIRDEILEYCDSHYPSVTAELETVLDRLGEEYSCNHRGVKNLLKGLFGKR